MQLVKYYGYVKSSFKHDKVLRIRNTKLYEEGEESVVVARTGSTIYTFHDNEKCVSICSTVGASWDKNSVLDVVRRVVEPCSFRFIDRSFIFESHVDLGKGGPELLQWLLVKNRREDVLFKEYDPEVNDALIVHFQEFNKISITSHVFVDGRVVHVCCPKVTLGIDIIEEEASLIDCIFQDLLRDNKFN